MAGCSADCRTVLPVGFHGEISKRMAGKRDKADGRVGVDHYSIILSSESVTIALTSGDSGRPPMGR